MALPSHLALVPAIDEFRREFERLSADADALVTPPHARRLPAGSLRETRPTWAQGYVASSPSSSFASVMP